MVVAAASAPVTVYHHPVLFRLRETREPVLFQAVTVLYWEISIERGSAIQMPGRSVRMEANLSVLFHM